MSLFVDPNALLAYIHAGKAILTLKSKVTDKHFTYKITKKDTVYFVSVRAIVNTVLPNPTKSVDYIYLGTIFADTTMVTPTKKSDPNYADAFRGFDWLYQNLRLKHDIPPLIEVRHEGACGRCGRKLTNPISIDDGIGPECKEIMRCQ